MDSETFQFKGRNIHPQLMNKTCLIFRMDNRKRSQKARISIRLSTKTEIESNRCFPPNLLY